jgi:CheY-like chemotaxis protein
MPVGYQDVNILIVDDDHVDVRAIQRDFHKQKIANPTTVACDGQEALDLLRGTNGRERLPRPYLILLDLNMPRMNGIRFLQELRQDPALHDSIVFVLTTSASDEDTVAAYKHNIAGYIVKSDAGPGFLKLIQLLEYFVLTVQFPIEHPIINGPTAGSS